MSPDSPQLEHSWWRRPCGGREVLVLALPLIVSMASWSIMHFVDRTFLIWYSSKAVAASLQGGTLYWAVTCFPVGIASYVNTFVAQYHGARRYDQIGPAVWQGLWIALASTPLFWLLIPVSSMLFAATGHTPEAAENEAIYFNALMWGAGAAVISAAQSTYFSGRGVTRVIMLADIFANIINAVLAYALIFGRLGLPELGLMGAGLATSLAHWFKVAYFSWLMWRDDERGRSALGKFQLQRAMFFRILKYAMPNGTQMFLEISAFAMFVLLMGSLGDEANAATALAFNINGLAFIPMIGLGLAVSILVGNRLGENQPELAARATWTAFVMAMCYSLAFGAAYLLLPDVLLASYRSGSSPEEFAHLEATIVVLLRFVAAYCLFDAMNLVFVNALKGAGDTRFIMFTSLGIFPWPLTLAWVGTHFFDGGLFWCWAVLTLWVSALGLIYFARFQWGPWRNLRVIEPTVTADVLPAENLAEMPKVHAGMVD